MFSHTVGDHGWVAQIHCIKDSHLTTLWYPTLLEAQDHINDIRVKGMSVLEDDGSFTNWPPHLLGCFSIYDGKLDEGMGTPYTRKEVVSMK